MDDAVVDLLEGLGFQQQRLGLGTPDLAAASKLVADEHQHRLALGAGERRCGGDDATHHQGPSVEHGVNSVVEAPRDDFQYEGALPLREAGLTAL
jgi:hypothetical protein